MYLFELLDEERQVKSDIEFIENEIEILKLGAYGYEHLHHKRLEDAYTALENAKLRLRMIHVKMRDIIKRG